MRDSRSGEVTLANAKQIKVPGTRADENVSKKARVARNVLHIRGKNSVKFDVNEEAWPNADLAIHSSCEGALIDGLPADKVKAGDEREIKQMKNMQLYSWAKETDIPPDKSILLTGWARRLKESEVRSRCVLKDFATTVRDDVFAPTPSPLSVRGLTIRPKINSNDFGVFFLEQISRFEFDFCRRGNDSMFLVCSKFNHTQCGRTCACAVA